MGQRWVNGPPTTWSLQPGFTQLHTTSKLTTSSHYLKTKTFNLKIQTSNFSEKTRRCDTLGHLLSSPPGATEPVLPTSFPPWPGGTVSSQAVSYRERGGRPWGASEPPKIPESLFQHTRRCAPPAWLCSMLTF